MIEQTPSTPPRVSICVVAYNSAACISDCIGSIAVAAPNISHEILLIDNGDGATENLVREKFPQVVIIPSRGNIGFGAGNNELARHARGDFLLLLNPDVELLPNAIDALFRGVEAHPTASVWGGVTLDRNGKANTGNLIPVPSLRSFAWAVLGRSQQTTKWPSEFDCDVPVPHLSGAFMMITRDAWNAAKGFDERFFLYCEEVDLFHRLAAMGHTFWQIADARAYHEAFHGEAASPRRALYSFTGRVEFTRAHWSTPRRLLGFFLLWLGALARFIGGRIFGIWRPRLRARADASRIVALRPWLWMHGYDPDKGLLAQLKRNGGKLP